MVKTSQYDSTTLMTVLYSIVFSPSFCRDFTIVVSHYQHCTVVLSSSYYHHSSIVVSPSYCRCFIIMYYYVFTIVLSLLHHRTIVFSPSYYRVFNIALSRFSPASYYCGFISVLSHYHHRRIAFSPSHYLVFTILVSHYRHPYIALSLGPIAQSCFHYRAIAFRCQCKLNLQAMALAIFHIYI